MARDTGKWVARAAATGGSRTYRGQRPVNWYAALVVIVVLGLASVAYARSEYHPSATTSTSTTTTISPSTTWYAGLQLDVCGTTVKLPASSGSQGVAQGLTTDGTGIIAFKPTVAGKHPPLTKFEQAYTLLHLTSTELAAPGHQALRNGDRCPAKTPDAGKKGHVVVRYYPDATVDSFSTVTDPSTIQLGQYSLVLAGFVPSAAKLTKSSSIELALLRDKEAAANTTTSSPTASSTPGVPLSTAPAPGASTSSVATTPTSSPASTTPTTTATTTTPTK